MWPISLRSTVNVPVRDATLVREKLAARLEIGKKTADEAGTLVDRLFTTQEVGLCGERERET